MVLNKQSWGILRSHTIRRDKKNPPKIKHGKFIENHMYIHNKTYKIDLLHYNIYKSKEITILCQFILNIMVWSFTVLWLFIVLNVYWLSCLAQMSEINYKIWICFKKVALRNDPVVLGRSAWFFASRKASLVWEPLRITDCTQIGWFL